MSKARKFIKVKDSMVEVPEDAEEIVVSLQGEQKSLQDQFNELKEKYDSLLKDNETMRGQLDEYQASNKDNAQTSENKDEAEIEKKAEEREAVKDVAMKIAPNFNCKGKTIAEIKAAVISAKHNGLTLDGRSPEYINARYDAIAEEVEKSGYSRLNSAINDAMGSSENFEMSEREKMIQRNLNAYKGNK